MELKSVCKGVLVMKDGLAWQDLGSDGKCHMVGWGDPLEAPIRDPKYCKRPEDVTYSGSPFIKELKGASVVPVTKTTLLEIGGGMMSDVTRFYPSIEEHNSYPVMDPHPDGDYVTYTAYAELERKLAERSAVSDAMISRAEHKWRDLLADDHWGAWNLRGAIKQALIAALEGDDE